MTVKQIAERAGVGINLVYAWCESGELRHFRLGAAGRRGKILISEDDWGAFLAGRQVGGQIPPAVSAEAPAEPSRSKVVSGALRHLKIRPR